MITMPAYEKLETRIDGSVAVIGDVHGQSEQLLQVLTALEQRPDFADLWVVFVGDLVDRGPDPAGVIQIIIEFIQRHPKTTVVCG